MLIFHCMKTVDQSMKIRLKLFVDTNGNPTKLTRIYPILPIFLATASPNLSNTIFFRLSGSRNTRDTFGSLRREGPYPSN